MTPLQGGLCVIGLGVACVLWNLSPLRHIGQPWAIALWVAYLVGRRVKDQRG